MRLKANLRFDLIDTKSALSRRSLSPPFICLWRSRNKESLRPLIRTHVKGKQIMSNSQGGSHEQHVKAGEQSHKNTSGSGKTGSEEGSRGGSHEQHVKAGEQSHKNTSGSGKTGSEEGSRGGSHERHVKAGQQSHKNS